MKRRITRGILTLAFSLALSVGLESTSNACLFPGLFGPGCGCWGPVYRPCYPPVYVPPRCPPPQTFYGPVYPTCGPVCSPCRPACPPCGPVFCPSGSCGVNPQPQPAVKTDDGWQPSDAEPKTFADEEPTTVKEPAAVKEPMPEAAEDVKPADPFNQPGEKPKPEFPSPDESPKAPAPGKIKVEKPVSPVPETVIEKKKPAPPALPLDENGKEDVKSGGDSEKTEKETPGETKESGTNPQLRGPSLNLDEKITWRSTPKRTRLVLQATFRSPKIVRKSVDPNARRAPVPRGAEIARN